MKTATAATLVMGLLVASVMLTAVSVLGNLDQQSDDIRMEDLAAGRLGPMLSGPTLLARYPSFPRPMALFHIYSMFLVGGLVAASMYVLRIRLRKPLGAVSIAALALGVVPYALGMFVLQTGSADAKVCGYWVAVMVCGVLYASLTAALLASLELTGGHTKICAWFTRRPLVNGS